MLVTIAVVNIIEFCKRVQVALVKLYSRQFKMLSLNPIGNFLAPKGDFDHVGGIEIQTCSR